MREWELAGNIHLVPRITQAIYLRLQYAPNFNGGFFSLGGGTAANPRTITLSGLSRGSTHEMGHALGFDHEHIRPDRDAFLTINWANIDPGGSNYFVIVTLNRNDAVERRRLCARRAALMPLQLP